jgi:hypothetical protein
MERDMDEILASQARMLTRNGNENEPLVSNEEIRASYIEHLTEVTKWLADKDWIQTLFVSYNQTLLHPMKVFDRVALFLDHRVDSEAMTKVVDPDLYREQG